MLSTRILKALEFDGLSGGNAESVPGDGSEKLESVMPVKVRPSWRVGLKGGVIDEESRVPIANRTILEDV
jgi:hypothetical protein